MNEQYLGFRVATFVFSVRFWKGRPTKFPQSSDCLFCKCIVFHLHTDDCVYYRDVITDSSLLIESVHLVVTDRLADTVKREWFVS